MNMLSDFNKKAHSFFSFSISKKKKRRKKALSSEGFSYPSVSNKKVDVRGELLNMIG